MRRITAHSAGPTYFCVWISTLRTATPTRFALAHPDRLPVDERQVIGEAMPALEAELPHRHRRQRQVHLALRSCTVQPLCTNGLSIVSRALFFGVFAPPAIPRSRQEIPQSRRRP